MVRILKVSEDELETIVNRQVSDLLARRRKFDPASLQWFGKLQSIDLGKAHSNSLIWDRGGRGLFVTKMDGTPTTTLIRFNDIAGSTYEVRAGYIKDAFQRIYLTNVAESGKTLKFIVGYRNFAEFMLTDPATQTTLAVLAAKDFATQATLALIKVKTDTLATTTRRATSAPSVYNVAMTNADTEYSQALGGSIKVGLRFILSDLSAFRYAWEAGKVAAPTPPYMSVPINTMSYLQHLGEANLTLYFASSEAGKTMQIEVIQ